MRDGSQRGLFAQVVFPGATANYFVIVRLVSRLVACTFLVLAGCGQVEPVLLKVSMPDCTYQGPSSMRAGEASLSLGLNGLGDARVLLVALTGGHSYQELSEEFDSNAEWAARPDWIEAVLDVELGDDQGVSGMEETTELTDGRYAIICVDQTTGTAQTASPLEVRG